MKRTPEENLLLGIMIIFVIWLSALAAHEVLAADAALIETRCCVVPARTADGKIKRRADVLAAFQKIHPCPSTGMTTGACPGWGKNHTIPLFCNGKDSVDNISWVPLVMKSGAGALPVDRWERKVYCSPQVLVPMPSERLNLMAVP